MKKITICCESHYFDSSKAGYGGYVIEYKGRYKTHTTISVHNVPALISLDMLWVAIRSLKVSCDITVISRQNFTTSEMKSGEGRFLWDWIDQLQNKNGHKYTYKKYQTESELDLLNEMLKELIKIKRTKIDFNKVLKDDNI